MIPQVLRDKDFWCVWRREIRGGKPTKVPYNPHTGGRAATDSPDTFGSFDLADERYMTEDYDGVGIRLSHGISAVDIDHCVNDGVIDERAMDIIGRLKSYTEFSPSKTGIRIIFEAPNLVYDSEKYYLKNPSNGIEIYVCGATNRFVTMTGNTCYDFPVRDVTDDLTAVLDAYMVRPKKRGTHSGTLPETTVIRTELSDEEIIAKASRNDKFYALFFRGDLTDYNDDHSSADLALCNMLAFWTGRNEDQIDRLFRKSALYRESKWNRTDYSRNTINLAISDCDEIYDANAPQVSAEAKTVFDRLGVPALHTFPWDITDNGVTIEELADKRSGETKTVLVTSTPIVPVRRLVNADTGMHKIELAFRLNGRRRTIIVDAEVLASKNKIVTLANSGVDVTTATASRLVDYLNNIQQKNDIPEEISVSHLGWVDDKFLPYDEGIVFDGETSDKKLFNAIKTHGSESAWVDFMYTLRQNKPLRMTMAASFASPLIERCGALPFVFHLWGTTGGGKTVALKTAMSVWGRPDLGELVYTMNMTDNAMMNTAGLLYSLPFAGDELQLVKSQYGYDRLIMRVTEGIDRGRMKYDAKVAQKTWRNAFLFTGEEPCTNYNSGGGTKNRVIEVNADDGVVEDGSTAANFITENYGHAGRTFINYAKTQNLRSRYRDLYSTVDGVTDKQALAATMILLGDSLACECLFTNEKPLVWSDIAEFFLDDEEVSTAKRAEEFIRGWLSQNKNKFAGDTFAESYGLWEGFQVCVIDHVLVETLNKQGFSFDAVKREWAESGFLVKYNNKFKARKGMNGIRPYCVTLSLM